MENFTNSGHTASIENKDGTITQFGNVPDPSKVICIGLPNTGSFDFNVVASLFSLQPPRGYCLHFHFMSNCLIYDARERLVEYALENKFPYLFFLDSDMCPPPFAILKLYEALEAGFDISTGMIFKRKYPFQPCFYTQCTVDKDFNPMMEGPLAPETWPKSGFTEIAACGMACCLIKMSLFDKMDQKQKPYFFPLPKMGEDLAFCLKARHAGGKIAIVWDVDCAHLGTFPVMKSSFEGALRDWMANPNNKGKVIFND